MFIILFDIKTEILLNFGNCKNLKIMVISFVTKRDLLCQTQDGFKDLKTYKKQ